MRHVVRKFIILQTLRRMNSSKKFILRSPGVEGNFTDSRSKKKFTRHFVYYLVISVNWKLALNLFTYCCRNFIRCMFFSLARQQSVCDVFYCAAMLHLFRTRRGRPKRRGHLAGNNGLRGYRLAEIMNKRILRELIFEIKN